MKLGKHTVLEAVKWAVALSPWAATPFLLPGALTVLLEVPLAVYVLVGGLLRMVVPVQGYGTRYRVEPTPKLDQLPLLVFDEPVLVGESAVA